MKILGIETSCDETAAAIIDDEKNILSNVVNSQIDLHKIYGGVVPEIAARSHGEIIDKIIAQSLKEANLELNEIDAIAATCGPGLIGGVIVGAISAKAIASALNKPFLAINHLEAHLLTPRLTNEIEFPYLALLLSGGHCQILLAKKVGEYEKIGETIDDALGEAFDKVSQMLGLGYPGGPIVEKLAKIGDENRFNFPKPLLQNDFEKKNIYNFSFSGLKTAVRRQIEELIGENFSHLSSAQKIKEQDKADICASFQRTVCEILINRLKNVASGYDFKGLKPNKIVISGGVAANLYIFSKLEEWSKNQGFEIFAPPLKLCTDNGAMIAWAGIERAMLGLYDDLSFKPRAKWPLNEIKSKLL